MDSARWNEIKTVFNSALDLSPDERPAFLERFPDDLRSEVEALIIANSEASDFIAEPFYVGLGVIGNGAIDSLVGSRVDSYEIVREIGHGGMGAVYLATRHGDFEKQVALKLIKRGMDTAAVLKRFMMERQILAHLEHPNIASLLDGGTTDDGLPYFVMEYVEGQPITKFCDAHGYSIEQRLELFRNVCAAISYAHQSLVIHRDIKPSNILVNEDGTPKLLDFGIAKLLNPDWSLDTNEATATMFRAMTPEYASPEQIRGEMVTTASDVYSLGVVLFELLCGERPFRTADRGRSDIENHLLTSEPVRPSAVVSRQGPMAKDTAGNNGVQTNPRPRSLDRRSLRGDLDNIVLKALRKEPERRYQSVHEFSDDIRRHLAGLPVSATADTLSYRAAKFAQRHRAGLITAALIFLTLAGATGVTAWQAIVARQERDKAQQRFSQLRELANTIIFTYHDKIKDLPGTVELRQTLVTDALKYLDNLAQSSEGDLSLERDLVKAYEKVGEVQFGLSNGNIGNSAGAVESYRKALELAQKIVEDPESNTDDRVKLANVFASLAGALGQTGDIRSDIQMKQQAIDILESLAAKEPEVAGLQDNLAKVRWYLGTPLMIVGEDDKAMDNFERAIAVYQALLEREPGNLKYRRNVGLTYKYMSQILTRKHAFDRSMEIARKALDMDRSRESELPNEAQVKYDISASETAIGDCLLEMNDDKAAIESFTRVASIRESLAAKDPKNAYYRDTLSETYHRLSIALEKLGRNEEAVAFARKAIGLLSISLQADDTDVYNHIRLAQYKLALGNASISTAGKTEPGSVACQNFRESADIWNKLKATNNIPKFDEDDVALTNERLDACSK